MDIYISKKCVHCKKLLVVFYNNKYLIPYFNIIDVESVQIPNFITSVPTLVYNDELYFDERMYNLIDDVNQHHLKNNSGHSNIEEPPMINQQPETIHPPMGTQSQSNMMDESRTPNLNSERQPALNRGDPNPSKKMEKPVEDNEIMGVCMGEDCLYENINDDDGGSDNSLMGGYCFLDDGYSEKKPDPSNSSSSGGKSSRFDDNAYEQLMKSRGNI